LISLSACGIAPKPLCLCMQGTL